VKRIVLAVAVAVALAASPLRAEEAVVTYKSIAPDIAFDLARTTLDRCRQDGYQIAVAVLDRFGQTLVVLRDRYTPAGAIRIARGKAWTAVTFTRDTGDFVKSLKDGTLSAGLANQPGVTPLVGGLVIQAGGSLLGSVGVAGAPGGDKDEACAKAGLESVRDKLEF
jgi:uncharacterized protein GlcG (DUF336 family)